MLYATKVESEEESGDGAESGSSKMPKLTNWQVQTFSNTELVFKFKFSNPIYVSSMEEPDLFSIDFLLPQIFQSKADGLALRRGSPIMGTVPRQLTSQAAFEQVKSVSDNASIFLLASLILPIFFKLFLSIGIIFDIVWDMFNMLQIVSNL